MNNKICGYCKLLKDIKEFAINKQHPEGVSRYCRNCLSQKRKIYIKTNYIQFYKKRQEYKKTLSFKTRESNKRNNRKIQNPSLFIWKNLQKKCKKNKIDFNLDVDDIIIPKICPVLKIPILLIGNPTKCPNLAVIDRIDNNQGYVKNNICVISNKANWLKKHGSLEDFKQILNYMENNK